MAAITVSNLRIAPYTQKDAYKPIFGDRLTFAVTLPTPHAEGDRYALGCDYERVVFPPARPLCAYTEEFSVAGETVTMSLLFATARFRDWVSTLRKPMPIYLQMVRLRGDTQETLLLDDILALPSVVDGQNVVCEGDPLQKLLDEKQDRPAQDGSAGQVLGLDNNGDPAWLHVGVRDIQSDWDESDSDSPAYIRHKPEIGPGGDYAPAPIVQSGAPTTSTPGAVGQLCVDTATSKTYHCTAVTTDDTDPQNPVTTYTWTDDINEKGGTITANGLTINWNYYLSCLRNNALGVAVASASADVIGTIGCITGGSGSTNKQGRYSIVFGQNLARARNTLKPCAVFGANNAIDDYVLCLGNGPTQNDKRNGLMAYEDGTLYIAGGHQQGVTVIPAATTAYTLAEGVQSHEPDTAPTYTLPAVIQRIVADGQYFTRDTTTDGTGYYGWISGTTNRYTASATPAVGDNTYTNTALTSGAKAITAIDNRTHEIILNVRFSATALSADFEDSEGNTIVPLSTPTIAAGTVVSFLCSYEPLLEQWVITPLVLGTYTAQQ